MSKIVRIIAGAALIVAGVLTGNVSLILAGAGLVVATIFQPKGPARTAQEMAIQLGEQPRCVLFGTTATAGSLVDGRNWGGKYHTKFEALIIRLADHKCEELVGVFVNDEFYEYTGDGDVPGFEDGDDAALQIYFRSDTTTQPLPSVITDRPSWAVGYNQGESGCDVVVVYEADKPDEKHPEWPGGRPRFLFVVKGKKCYDPRLDDTVVGGAGDHRWDDPSTWEWSDNPAVCRYNWVRGVYANDLVDNPAQLLVGRGLSASEAPPENIIAAANLCEEIVGSAKRYTVSGPVYSQQPFIEVEEMFAAATGGQVVTREGSVELEPGAAKSVVASFTDDDLVVGTEVSWNQGVLSEADPEWVNTVVARYVEPTQKWADHAAPVVRDASYILADGAPREAQATLRLVNNAAQAQRVAEILLRLGRLWGRGQVTLGPRFCEIEDGDWVNWVSPRRFPDAPSNTVTFRVEAYSINEKWQNTLTLRQINSDVYDDVTLRPSYADPFTPTDAPPDIGSPDADNWDLAAVSIDDSGVSRPALEITGSASDDDTAEAIIFEYWKDDGVIDPVANPDDPTWSVWGTLPPSTTKVDITGVEGGADYYAAVTYIVDGEPGDKVVLGPVTAGSTDISGAVDPIVDAAVNALSWKAPVRVATTAAGTLASSFENGDTVDGVTLATGDRILIKNQATASENGIYVAQASGAPVRASDANSGAEMVCATVKVSEGTTNADSEWTCTTNAPITLGSTSITFASAGGSGRLIGRQIFTSGSGTYTPTTGTNSIVIELQGGGGGGGGVANPAAGQSAGANGGGGGGYLRKRLTANFSGASYAVGAKGTGGAAGNNAGGNGGNTTFTETGGSPTTYTAAGGVGGVGGGSQVVGFVRAGSAGGTATNGDINITGQASDIVVNLNSANTHGGNGGFSHLGIPGGGGTAILTALENGIAGKGYGSGGGGGASNNGAGTAAGGNGADGVIIIWEYS